MYTLPSEQNSYQLQSTCSASTSGVGTLPPGVLHHPITCTSKIFYEEDGSFSCEHGTVPADDPRTQACVIHSVALLIVELAMAL